MSFRIFDDNDPQFYCPNCGKGYNAWWWNKECDSTESITCWECDFEFEVEAEVCSTIYYTVKPIENK